MSHDSWGGGTDRDPLMRVRELEEEQRARLYRMLAPTRQRPKPRVSVFDGLLLLIAAVAALVVLASLR